MNNPAAQSGSPSLAAQKTAETSARPQEPGAGSENQNRIRMGQAFSQIVAVLMRDANFKKLRLADLEWLVLPPILAGQYKLGFGQARDEKTKKTGVSVPAAVAFWARVSSAVDKRLTDNVEGQIQLQPHEWVSGNHLWLIAAAGDQRVVRGLLKDLDKTEFDGQPVKLRVSGADGKAVIQTLTEYAP